MANRLNNLLFQNLANIITVIGLVLSVWLVVSALIDPECLWLITLLALFIGLSDFLDGKIAKHLKIKSSFGSTLDRLRDKIFICPTLLILIYYYQEKTFQNLIVQSLTIGLVLLIIVCEIFLLFTWFYATIKKLDASSNQYGRIKMFLEFSGVMFWLISLDIEEYFFISVITVSIYLIDIVFVFTLYYAIKSIEAYYQRYYKNRKNQAYQKTN